MQFVVPEIATESQQQFCMLQVKSLIDQIFTFIQGLAFVMVIVYMIHRCFQLRKIKFNRTIKKLLVAMIVWSACFGVKVAFSILLYQSSKQKDQNSQDVKNFLSNMSKIYFCLDWTSAFIIQYMIILIPYHWMQKTNDIMKQLLAASRSQEEHIETNIIKILRVYLKLRLIAVPALLLIIFIHEYTVESWVCQILLCLLLLESFVAVLVYIKGLLSLSRNKKVQDILDEGQVSTMKNQYIILIFSCILRIVLDFFTVIVLGLVIDLSTPKNCNFDNPNQIVYSAVLLIISPICTHFIPIVIVLRIFSVQQVQPSLSKSLLLATSQQVEN